MKPRLGAEGVAVLPPRAKRKDRASLSSYFAAKSSNRFFVKRSAFSARLRHRSACCLRNSLSIFAPTTQQLLESSKTIERWGYEEVFMRSIPKFAHFQRDVRVPAAVLSALSRFTGAGASLIERLQSRFNVKALNFIALCGPISSSCNRNADRRLRMVSRRLTCINALICAWCP
jgi:hypothetical protein